MQPGEYIVNAIQTESQQFNIDKINPRILHAAIGLSTEAGELLDALKKTLFYNKDFDIVNVREELGDVLWYLAIICHATGSSFEELMAANIAKLRARFPNRFTEFDAQNRNLTKERHILEAKLVEHTPDDLIGGEDVVVR